MADATIKAWKCDCCGKVYKEGDGGYFVDYQIQLNSHSSFGFMKIDLPQICSKCAEEIYGFVEQLQPNNKE